MKLIQLSLILILLSSCGVSRFVEPLEKKQHAVSVGLGGPIIDFGGAPVPVPLTNVAYGYGIDSNVTFFSGLHITSAAFANLQVDFGINYRPWNWKNPAIPKLAFSPTFNFIYDRDDYKVKFWPQLDFNMYWNFGKKKHYVYVGLSNWFELAPKRSADRVTLQHWIPCPQIGLVFKEKTREYCIETKFINPGAENTYSFIRYRSIMGKYGASGIYFNFVQKF
jgi:hypothetical protein